MAVNIEKYKVSKAKTSAKKVSLGAFKQGTDGYSVIMKLREAGIYGKNLQTLVIDLLKEAIGEEKKEEKKEEKAKK